MRSLGMLALLPLAIFAQSGGTYWPGEKWRSALPETQGIDSQALAAAVDQVTQKQLGVHSLLVIRHGYVVLDTTFYPYDGSSPHDLASVTKSLTSLLTGVAVNRGVLKLEQPLLPLFPREAPADPSEQKRALTVGHLLRMESGLDCGIAPGERELEDMKRSANWVHFALALPMKYDAGTHTSYCSPGYHLLGSSIAAASKMTELDFARKYLFGPLGIRGVVWADDPQGRSHGWGDSHFFPQDVAKLGYLYLHGGNWNGTQVVSADWVKMSITPPTGERGGPGALGYEWGASNGANGRQFGGTGRGGQSLIVWPDLDMVVVSLAGGNAGQIAQMVRQAVKSEQPLPANPEAYAALQEKIGLAHRAPAAVPVAALPARAAAISGVTYQFPVNPSRIDSLSLHFGKNGDARVDVEYYGEPLHFPLGLDGVYRLGPNGPLHLEAGARGKWTGENEFLLDLNFIANINHYTLALQFQGDQVEMTASEASGLIRNGKLVGKKKP